MRNMRNYWRRDTKAILNSHISNKSIIKNFSNSYSAYVHIIKMHLTCPCLLLSHLCGTGICNIKSFYFLWPWLNWPCSNVELKLHSINPIASEVWIHDESTNAGSLNLRVYWNCVDTIFICHSTCFAIEMQSALTQTGILLFLWN